MWIGVSGGQSEVRRRGSVGRQPPHRHDSALADERIRVAKCWPNPRQDQIGVLVEVAQPLGGSPPHKRVGVFEQRQQERHAHTGLWRVEVTQLVRRPGPVGGRECPEPFKAVVEWWLRSRGKSPSNTEQEQCEAAPSDRATSKGVAPATWKPETHGSPHWPAYPQRTWSGSRPRRLIAVRLHARGRARRAYVRFFLEGGGLAVRPPWPMELEGVELDVSTRVRLHQEWSDA